VGDIGTHAEIIEHVTTEVVTSVPPTQIPTVDYTYLELGNFLTDVSQFRDPVAFHGARERARAQLLERSRLTKSFGGPEWLRDVFGQKTGPLHGALPEMLRMLMQAFTHEVFDDDALSIVGGALGLAPGGARPALIPAHGLPPARVDAVLAAHYTQYFPHEHLDFPPYPDMPRHNRDRIFARENRGLIGYLEWDLQYLSEELSMLEEAWVRARAGRFTAEMRQDFLVRLGHLLHPVEDYFFHSNLLELYQWIEVRSAHPKADPMIPADLRVLIDASLAGTRLNNTSVPLRRRLHRRLRYPIYDSQTALSRTSSEDGARMVFTGGFGPTDVWHTLGGALEAIESKLALLPARLDPRTTPLVLIRLLLSQKARRDMVSRNNSTEMWNRHRDQLRAGDYATAIAGWQSSGLLCPHAAAELGRAIAHDLMFTNRHAGKIFDFPGPGSVLILMLDEMQRERDAAATAAQKLDAKAMSIYDQASSNGCSTENVGTHSLMSKDSKDKEPMRPEAMAFAKHVSASIARLLLERVHSATPVTEGLDWDALLRFYVRGVPNHPTSGPWESELLQRMRAGGAFHQPRVRELNQQPGFGMLGPSRDPLKLALRRAGQTKSALETYYRRFESNPR
jgi:hypothetical protein